MSGFITLDGNGKIPLSQMHPSVVLTSALSAAVAPLTTAQDSSASAITALQAAVATLQAKVPIKVGTATLVAGAVTISIPAIAANSIVLVDRFTLIGTIGVGLRKTVTAGTSLKIESLTALLAVQILDTSVVHYAVLPPI